MKIFSNISFVILAAVCMLSFWSPVKAETLSSNSVLYVPLIGITSIPDPLALPGGSGNVTYHYAVKNFLTEVNLTGVQVADDSCSPVTFAGGDDNGDSQLNYSETWRYVCTTGLSKTTSSTVTATGMANGITATHKAYTTVVVGSDSPPPLVSIVNVTKVAYPLSVPPEGQDITFIYKVNNPGVVALSDVTVTDDKCHDMSGKLGDTNTNNLLDINEVWIYTCTMNITQTTTDTATVTAFANGFRAVDSTALTVTVDTPVVSSTPNLFDVGIVPVAGVNLDVKTILWAVLTVLLVVLIMIFFLIQKR